MSASAFDLEYYRARIAALPPQGTEEAHIDDMIRNWNSRQHARLFIDPKDTQPAHTRGVHRFGFGLPEKARLWIPVGPRARLNWFELTRPDATAGTGKEPNAER